jgi:hypothetical protein
VALLIEGGFNGILVEGLDQGARISRAFQGIYIQFIWVPDRYPAAANNQAKGRVGGSLASLEMTDASILFSPYFRRHFLRDT